MRYESSRKLSKSGSQQVLKSAGRVSAVLLNHADHADSQLTTSQGTMNKAAVRHLVKKGSIQAAKSIIN